MKKRILVTGGYGFIAGYVIELLKEQGYQPVVLIRHIEEAEILEDCIPYLGDIRDKALVYGAIEHVDGVIHLAGLLGTSENIRQAEIMNETNINGALNVLNAIDNFNIPGVIIGVGNHFENNTYSISKTTAERYALMYAQNFGTKVSVVRALNAIGPRQKWGKIKKIIPTFINAALRDEDIKIYGGVGNCGIMDMVYAGDVAKVLLDVLEGLAGWDGHRAHIAEEPGKIFEAGTGKGWEVWQIADLILKLIPESKSKLVEVPMRAGESNRSKVIAENPYPIKYKELEPLLKETIQYYRDLMSE